MSTRRRARRNPEYKGWRRVMQKRSTAKTTELIGYGVLAYVGYQIYRHFTGQK